MEEFVTALNAVPDEFKYYHHDGLHLSDVGLTKQCSIILSNLYKTLAPASYKQRKESRLARSTPHKTNARNMLTLVHLMEDYQRHLQRCNYKYNLCFISKDPAAHQKDNVQRLQKYQNTQSGI